MLERSPPNFNSCFEVDIWPKLSRGLNRQLAKRKQRFVTSNNPCFKAGAARQTSVWCHLRSVRLPLSQRRDLGCCWCSTILFSTLLCSSCSGSFYFSLIWFSLFSYFLLLPFSGLLCLSFSLLLLFLFCSTVTSASNLLHFVICFSLIADLCSILLFTLPSLCHTLPREA